ncbi:MAG TPA: oligosaccharide flippase family protein [Patescibacteria group bacterium]|nr:oligosaccharide flippase family protein [Patescibacteria group bacterium]
MRIATVLKIIKTQLARHISLVLAANMSAAALGFISLLLVARGLSVADFGLFNVAISLILVIQVFTAFGIDTSMVTHVSSYLGKEKPAQAKEVVSAGFIFIIINTCAVGLCIYAAAPYIAKNIFHLPQLVSLLRLASLGIACVSLFNYTKTTFYAYKQFKQYAFILLLVDTLKLAVIFTLARSSRISASSAVAAFGLSPLLGAILGTWVLRDKFSLSARQVKKAMLGLLDFTKWIFVSDMAKQIFPYVGTFMLAKLLDSKAAGMYGLALNLTYAFPILINSFNSVLLPELSRFKQISQFENYLKTSFRILSYLVAAAIPCTFFSARFIIFFFGSRYVNSIVVLNWLIFNYLVTAVNSTLLNLTLYSLKKPRIVAVSDIARLTAMFLGCFFLIPRLGIVCPAVIALLINTSAAIFLASYVFNHIKLVKSLSPA